MAVTPKNFYASTLTTTTTATLYTAPGSTTAVVSEIVIHNPSGSSTNLTLKIGGAKFMTATPIAAGATIAYGPEEIRRVVPTGGTITGGDTGGVIELAVDGAEYT